MKRILIIAGLLLLSAALFVSVALLGADSQGTEDQTSHIASTDISSDTTSQEISSSDPTLGIDSSDFSEYISPEPSSSRESSSEETSSEGSSEETSSAPASSESASSTSASSGDASSEAASSSTTSSEDSTPVVTIPSNETRAIWISYLELSDMLTGKTRSQFVSNFTAACQNVANFGLNTVIVHVRPFSDALYESDYFPWSHIATGTQGKDPGFDPLEEMVRIAHQQGLKIEAWINPYRIRTSAMTLSSDNPASQWKNTDKVVSIGNNMYYNPAYEEVQNLIANGVKEIVENYDVDGIHFDDYFYPTTDASFDATAYNDYKSGGGTQSLAAFRRANVTSLMSKVYSAVKGVDSSVVFGISPQGNNDTNYNSQYVDVQTIINRGYIDYICPQIYYGFNHGSCPYEETVSEWNSYVRGTGVKLYVGLAAYKIGTTDQWAGSGKNEWLSTTDILKRQVISARSYNGYKGFFIYTYSSIFTPTSSVKAQIQQENKNLQSILK